MAYLDDLLASNEEVKLVAHRHIVFLLLRTVPFLLATLVLWVGAIFAYRQLDTGRTIVTLLLLAVSLVPLGVAIFRYLSWHREQYALTNYRIIQVEGIINKHTYESSLEKINDVQLQQNLFGRLFGYGDIRILTGTDSGVNHLHGIAEPFAFKRTLQETKLDLGDNDHTRRAARFAAASEVTAQPVQDTFREPAREAAPAHVNDPARLMAALVDLRDSGVISEAEYAERRDQLLNQQ